MKDFFLTNLSKSAISNHRRMNQWVFLRITIHSRGRCSRFLNLMERFNQMLSPPISDQETFNLYQKMVFIRLADQRALMLQRQGRMGTYAPIWGQEACQVGSAAVLQKGDWVFPAFQRIRSSPDDGDSTENGLPLLDGQ